MHDFGAMPKYGRFYTHTIYIQFYSFKQVQVNLVPEKLPKNIFSVHLQNFQIFFFFDLIHFSGKRTFRKNMFSI